MSLMINDTAPNFKAQTTIGEIDFHEWLGGQWGVLFSHPKDLLRFVLRSSAIWLVLSMSLRNAIVR